ncbi:calnexin-like [Poeciliopsis prolifica]|nr:calnexin-like [Poeciliopsis prolifica]
MHQKALLFVLLAVGLVCLGLAPACRAQNQDEDADVEDDLDLDLAGTEDDDELDGDEEAPPAPKAPTAPKVTYKAPEPMGEHFFAESFDRGTLDG